MNLLRIAQEAVANAVKHGQAQTVHIELEYASTFVCLTVIDDGRGFLASQDSPIGHFGLLDMRERAQSMGTQLTLETEPGHGTLIMVRVPVDSSAANHAELKTN